MLQLTLNVTNFVWNEIMTKVDKGGWLLAPWMANALWQRDFQYPRRTNKVRLVDDFTICGVNGAYGLREKLRVQALDELCSSNEN